MRHVLVLCITQFVLRVTLSFGQAFIRGQSFVPKAMTIIGNTPQKEKGNKGRFVNF